MQSRKWWGSKVAATPLAAPALDSSRAPATLDAHPPTPARVLYCIDQLCSLGGAERMLLALTRGLPPQRYVAEIATFALNPELESSGLCTVPLHLFPLRRTYDLRAARAGWRFRRLLQQRQFDIVHCFFETADLWAAPIARLSGRPHLVSSRRDMGILRTRKHRLAYPFVNRIFDRVLTVSEEVRQQAMRAEGLPSPKLRTIYNGVDLDAIEEQSTAYDARARFALDRQAPVVTLVANVRKVKGIDVLLRAAHLVLRQMPAARFVIAGEVLEPSTMLELQSLAATLGIAHAVLFPGSLANPYPLLKASNAFVLPSRSEGFSNALIEAMACGLPSVVTTVGGNAEAIEDGVTGYLCPVDNHACIALRLLELLADPACARAMGTRARRTARERFSLARMIGAHMAIYDELREGRHDRNR